MSLKAVTTYADFRNIVSKDRQKIEANIVKRLAFAGEKAANYCRNLRTYQDRTGNLRSSIGYTVYYNSVKVAGNVVGNSEGTVKANEVMQKAVSAYPSGFVLVLVAGMNYAVAVESRGYDVISGGSLILSNELKRQFNK